MSLTIKDLPCGAKVKFGAYCVENEGAHKIKWIKVQGNDTILQTEFIEDFRAFDAREPNSPQEYRREYGNNRYSVSNIDQFLNSTGERWFVAQHDNDAPPTRDYTYDRTPYDEHHGFLADFNEWELDAILPTEIIVALPKCDDAEHDYERITRKVFLPSRTNVFGRSVRNTNEGSHWDYYRNGGDTCAYPTAQAVENTTMDGGRPEFGDTWYWWLRSPNADYACDARCVGRGGGGSGAYAYRGVVGVRPALKLNPEILVSDEPDDEGYYEIIQSYVEIVEVSEDEFFSILG